MPIDPAELNHEMVYSGRLNDIPDHFDHRETETKDCIHPIRDQGSCGSCWAFAVSEMASDRACILSGKEVNLVFSPQHLVDCDTQESGCNGA